MRSQHLTWMAESEYGWLNESPIFKLDGSKRRYQLLNGSHKPKMDNTEKGYE